VKDTKFKKGESGNPQGRARQILTSTDLRKRLVQDLPDILDTLLLAAKAGDMAAIKIILDRTHPPLKAQALPVVVPIGDNLPESGGNVVNATLGGEIPPDIGAMLITALTNQGKLVEIQELSKQLSRIETQLEQRK
jgi:hypothetical protein